MIQEYNLRVVWIHRAWKKDRHINSGTHKMNAFIHVELGTRALKVPGCPQVSLNNPNGGADSVEMSEHARGPCSTVKTRPAAAAATRRQMLTRTGVVSQQRGELDSNVVNVVFVLFHRAHK